MALKTFWKFQSLLSTSFKSSNYSTFVSKKQILFKHVTKKPKLWAYSHTNANSLKVTILGAAGDIGKTVSMMLKQSPFIDEICLYDTKCLDTFVTDLNFIDTKCKVASFCDCKDIQHALSRSNIVVIFASCQQSESCTYSSIFDRNAPIVKEFATSIAKFSPKSLIAIGAEPINSIVPMFSEVMKRHGHYSPNNIFGITTIDVVRANKFVSEILGLDPECVLVPIIGGHTEKTIVPVLSKTSPCAELTNDEVEEVTTSIRHTDRNLFKLRSTGASLSYAFATARFIISLVKALKGQTNIVECAYVKSPAHPSVKYLVSPLLLGPGGISKILGIPELNDYETCLLENAIPFLTEDIKKGEFAGGRPMDIVDGELREKPICDKCSPDANAPRCPPDHCEISSLFANK